MFLNDQIDTKNDRNCIIGDDFWIINNKTPHYNEALIKQIFISCPLYSTLEEIILTEIALHLGLYVDVDSIDRKLGDIPCWVKSDT